MKTQQKNQQIKLYFGALRRCFDSVTQKKWKIPQEDINSIFDAVEKVENKITLIKSNLKMLRAR